MHAPRGKSFWGLNNVNSSVEGVIAWAGSYPLAIHRRFSFILVFSYAGIRKM
jgi:hypothetical protein